MSREIEREDFLRDVLKLVAPGKPFREGLDNILRAETGALIVVGYDDVIAKIADGGFSIDSELNPAYLYELAKMDGAIIVTADLKRILYANTHLVPDKSVISVETGIRHRIAERVAKQTGNLVISISERRGTITLYQGLHRYALSDIGVILTKANQAIQTLEKYKVVLDQKLINLSAMEFEELVTLEDVTSIIHKIEMVKRIYREIETFTTELGIEGRLVQMQAKELISNVETESMGLYRDYIKKDTPKELSKLIQELDKTSYDDLLDTSNVIRLLGYSSKTEPTDEFLTTRGYRILNRIPRLPYAIVDNLVKRFGSLPEVMVATIDELDEVDGIGEVRAKTIKESLNRIQENVFIGRNI